LPEPVFPSRKMGVFPSVTFKFFRISLGPPPADGTFSRCFARRPACRPFLLVPLPPVWLQEVSIPRFFRLLVPFIRNRSFPLVLANPVRRHRSTSPGVPGPRTFLSSQVGRFQCGHPFLLKFCQSPLPLFIRGRFFFFFGIFFLLFFRGVSVKRKRAFLPPPVSLSISPVPPENSLPQQSLCR